MRSITRPVILTLALALLSISGLSAQGADEFDMPSDLQILFIDTEDGGDDPWDPGCHYHYGNDQCSAPEFFFSGDYCSPDGSILYEWTNTRCHEAQNDIKRYNCQAICQERYGTNGSCVTARRHCRVPRGKGIPASEGNSASCVCEETAG